MKNWSPCSYSNLIFFQFCSDRTFVSERNEASGCASASIHSRTANQDDVSMTCDFQSSNRIEGILNTCWSMMTYLVDIFTYTVDLCNIKYLHNVIYSGIDPTGFNCTFIWEHSDWGMSVKGFYQLLHSIAFRTLLLTPGLLLPTLHDVIDS